MLAMLADITIGNFVYYLTYYLILKYFLQFIYFIYKNFLRKRKDLSKLYGVKSWVLVTGASDGIGKGFCEEFAKMDFSIILVARNKEKLDLVATELLKKYPSISTKTICFDFATQTSVNDYLDTFSEIVNKYNVSILVNNVGIAIIV